MDVDENDITEIIDSDSDDVEIIEEASDNENIDILGQISSDSETELECDIWDDDCIVIHNQKRNNAINGYHLMPTCPMEHEVPPLKKQKTIETPMLNENLTKEGFIQLFKNKWATNVDMKTECVELFTDPFTFCIVDDFIADKTILNKIREEFNELKWYKRRMDLYEFFQSLDLVKLESKYINIIYEFLKTDVKEWLHNLTGLELYKMSSTCSCYSDTDYLLIHDDLQEDRMIAFVLYLTDPILGSDDELWAKEMGGILELFSKDEKGHPLVPVREVLPKNNRFIFFEVNNASFHQVSEVLNMDHCRLSINGWFHTPKPKTYDIPIADPPKTGLFSCERLSPLEIDFPLNKWINPQYLQNTIKTQIQNHIEKESEISLNDFFNQENYEELFEVLKNDDIVWEKVGPVNRRNYEAIATDIAPGIVKEVLNLFQSKTMFHLLQEYTDLDFNDYLKPGVKPTMRFELQRWKPGNYSLLTEYNWESENELDLIMYLGDFENLNIVGGQTMYVSMDQKIEDSLITIQPKANSLNIVFRDTARIVKYVSKRSFHEYFYMIVCSYKE